MTCFENILISIYFIAYTRLFKWIVVTVKLNYSHLEMYYVIFLAVIMTIDHYRGARGGNQA